jgi:TPR repeat protein
MGIAEDRYAAEAYWRSAAEVGDLGAMVLLGELLLENVQIYVTSSLEKDEGDFEVSDDQEAWDSTDSGAMEAEAKAWWHEAAARGSVEAAEKLKEYINV